MSEKSKEIKELIDKIRGSTPSSELQKEVEAVIKADEIKAKAKTEADKKKLDDIKVVEKKLKKDAIKEEAEKIKNEKEVASSTEEQKEKTNIELYNKQRKAEQEKDTKLKEPTEEDEVDADAVIKELTEQMEKMSKEIEALKKRKNYRTKPPKAEKVSELDDFIKQNITKDFEMVV